MCSVEQRRKPVSGVFVSILLVDVGLVCLLASSQCKSCGKKSSPAGEEGVLFDRFCIFKFLRRRGDVGRAWCSGYESTHHGIDAREQRLGRLINSTTTRVHFAGHDYIRLQERLSVQLLPGELIATMGAAAPDRFALLVVAGHSLYRDQNAMAASEARPLR